ncbi:MAG: AI-2E family transporter [Mycobacteriales bacterium]
MPDSPLTGGGESQRSLWGPDGSRLSESDAAPVDTPPDALPGAAAAAAAPPTGAVPARLAWLAGWSWRLLMIAAAVYVLFRVAEKLWLVTLPFLTALLITALLHPLVALLRTRLHLPRLLAAWLTIVLAFAVLFAVGTFVLQQMSSHYAALVDQGTVVANHIRDWLSRGPLHVHVDTSKVNTYGEDLRHYLVTHRSIAVSGVGKARENRKAITNRTRPCLFL